MLILFHLTRMGTSEESPQIYILSVQILTRKLQSIPPPTHTRKYNPDPSNASGGQHISHQASEALFTYPQPPAHTAVEIKALSS